MIDAGMHDGPPAPDAPGLCGNQIIPVLADRPNLYFVVDRSGSMSEILPGSAYNKYTNARIAIAEVLRAIGHRVAYGAALFPLDDNLGCTAGDEVFRTTVGDPPSYAAAGMDGPVLTSFNQRLSVFSPNGGTPTSATLDALLPTLSALAGESFVILATDGAPNCNGNASCSAAQCSLNIEGFSVGNQQCNQSFNCCDPALVVDGQFQCVDEPASRAAVEALAAAGIKTYVIGMPGSEAYAQVLDSLAQAGGTARSAAPYYYPVGNTAELIAALYEIGVTVAISCTIQLDQEPPEPGKVNVYFDSSVVPQAADGWVWVDSKTIEIRGKACDELKSGNVLQVQVVAGCPTVVPH